MNAEDAHPRGARRAISPLAALLASALVLVGASGALAALSFRFAPGSEPAGRPILVLLGLFGFTFLCYLMAIRFALKVKREGRLVAVILLASVLIRAVALCSWPILEIDIYRYVWDGAVTLEGISPYRYSPDQVLQASPHQTLPHDLRRLVELRDGSAALGTILAGSHYGELPTVYPPVSQAVFAMAVLATPPRAGVFAHVLVMKTVLVLFDLATIVVVMGLLRLARRHVGWAVAYARCPLVIKEIANSGHLDSVAVLLTTLALYLATSASGLSTTGPTSPCRGHLMRGPCCSTSSSPGSNSARGCSG